jgi:hypothetical protein
MFGAINVTPKDILVRNALASQIGTFRVDGVAVWDIPVAIARTNEESIQITDGLRRKSMTISIRSRRQKVVGTKPQSTTTMVGQQQEPHLIHGTVRLAGKVKTLT